MMILFSILTISILLVTAHGQAPIAPYPPPPPPGPARCPPGWVPLPNSFTCYYFIGKPVPWPLAKATCSSLLPNSELVIIDNGPESALVTDLAKGSEIWVADEISTYPYPRQCVKSVLASGQKLIAVPCNIPLPYVCELDISPNPCKVLPPNVPIALTFYPHPALPYKFIQCTLTGRPFVKLCAKGTVWNQGLLTCIVPLPYPPPLPYKKRRELSITIPPRPRPDFRYQNYDDKVDDVPNYRPSEKAYQRPPPPKQYDPAYFYYKPGPFDRTSRIVVITYPAVIPVPAKNYKPPPTHKPPPTRPTPTPGPQ